MTFQRLQLWLMGRRKVTDATMLNKDQDMRETADHFDVIVIGAGAAGRCAARTAASFGARVALVDHSPDSGVMMMEHIAGLKLRELIRRQQQDVLASSIHWRNMIAREAREHAAHAQQMLREQIAIDFLRHGVTYIEGAVALGMNRAVQIALPSGVVRDCTAGSVVIATGALRVPPQGMPPDDVDVCDHRKTLCDEPLAADLLIVGDDAGAVAHASLMTALGVPVTLVAAGDRIVPDMDEEHAVLLQHVLRQAGVKFHLGIGACVVERAHGRLRARLNDGTVLHPFAVRYISDLLPNTSGLGLAQAGVQVDAAGFIKADEFFRTTAHGIYAVGDVIGAGCTLEGASMQGRAAVCHIFRRASKEYVDRMPVCHVPSLPELAGVGLTEAQCKAQRIAHIVGRSSLERTLRGLIAGESGQLKLIFDATTRQLIGVHCIASNAADVVNIGQAVMHYGGTLEAFDALIPIETSYGLAYQQAAHDALKSLALA
jgi:NAD(P) transhydrogenase